MRKHKSRASRCVNDQLREQFAASERLEIEIKRNLGRVAYEY